MSGKTRNIAIQLVLQNKVARFKELIDIALYLPGSDSSHKIVETTRMGRRTVGIEVSRVFNPTYS